MGKNDEQTWDDAPSVSPQAVQGASRQSPPMADSTKRKAVLDFIDDQWSQDVTAESYLNVPGVVDLMLAWGKRERDDALRERNLEWIEWLEQHSGD